MKIIAMILITFFSLCTAYAQKVGIGTLDPIEKLDVIGNIKADSLRLVNGGTAYDFLMKKDSDGRVAFKKGHGAQAMNFIIATGGTFPNAENTTYDVTYIGEIKLYAGTVLPGGWQYCHGQILNIGSYQALYSLIENYYGGNVNQSTFALPDLRGAVPVSAGTSPAGYTWTLGQKSN